MCFSTGICDPHLHTRAGYHSMTHSADMCARTIRSACSLLRTWTLGDFYAWTLPQDENHEEEFQDRHRIPDYHLKIRHSQDSHWPQSFTAASVSEMVFHSFSPQGFQTIIHKKSWSKLTNWGKKIYIYIVWNQLTLKSFKTQAMKYCKWQSNQNDGRMYCYWLIL